MVKQPSTLSSSHVYQNMEGEIIKNGFNEVLSGKETESSFIEDQEFAILHDFGFCLWSPGFIENVVGGFMENPDRPAIRRSDGISVSQVSGGEMLINDQRESDLQVNRRGADGVGELGPFIGGIIEECMGRVMEHVCHSNNWECSIHHCRDSDPGIIVQSRVGRTNSEDDTTHEHMVGKAGSKSERGDDPLVPLLSLHKRSLKTLDEFDRNKNSHIAAINMDGSCCESGCPGHQNLSGDHQESDPDTQLPSLKITNFDSKSEHLTSASEVAGDFHFCCVNSHERNGIIVPESNGNRERLSECSAQCTCHIKSYGGKEDFDLGQKCTNSGVGGACIPRSEFVENGPVQLDENLIQKEASLDNSAKICTNDVNNRNGGGIPELVMKNGLVCAQVEKSNSASPQSVEDATDLIWDSDYDVIKDFNECLLEAERYPEAEFCECLSEDEMARKNLGSRLPSIMETSDESLAGAEPELEETEGVDVFDGTVIPVEHVADEEGVSGCICHSTVAKNDEYHSRHSLSLAAETLDIAVHSVEETARDLASSFSYLEVPARSSCDNTDSKQDDASKQSTFVPKLILEESGEASPQNSDSSGISPRDLEILQSRTKQLLNGHSSAPVTMSVEISQVLDRANVSDSAEPSPATTQDSGFDFRQKSRDLLFSESGSESLERSSYYSCDDGGEEWKPTIPSPGEKFEKSLLHAIQSLDSLNEQIVQFIFSPAKSVEFNIDNEFSPKDREALKSSMAIMRRLLVDAQVKFRKMVDDNRQLATRIDGSILTANQEMQELRQELQDTNKRLNQLGVQSPSGKNVKQEFQNGNTKGRRLSEAELEISKLQNDNSKLEHQIHKLMTEIKELKCTKAILNEQPSLGDLKLELIQYQQELVRAKEALQAMKSDRKRLKAEKVDLLSQMKQLYLTLEEKEGELREFIRNYELRMRESDESIKQLALEKDDAEREKWEVLKRARDAAERVVILKSEVDEKNTEIQHLEDELAEARAQIRELKDIAHKQKTASTSDTGISSGTDVQTPSEEQLPTMTMATYYESPPQSARSVKSDMFITNLSTRITSSHSSENLRGLGERSRSAEDVMDVCAGTLSGSGEHQKKKKKMMTGFSSLSRIFGRSSKRKSVLYGEHMGLEDEGASPRVSTLNEDNYNEKLQAVNQLKDFPLHQWKAHHVLAWLEIVMNMPRYGRQCAENIKSGKILSEMSDSELESALGVTNYLHRKKLRLAIDDLRDPAQVRYPDAGTIDHVWVAQVWMRDIGLPQYSAAFEAHHVDGRVLSTLSKKEMERCMQITRKFHQASILNGVELLRRVNFNREALSQRRSQCDAFNCDPLVWTNERLIQWVNSIDLQEYAPNLLESGVHGGVLVLEPSFNGETMAAALAIPPSKSYIRRHLTSEVEALLKPARIAAKVKTKKRNMSGSLGKSFERSFRGPGEKDDGKKKLSFRGSLGRAFGRKVKRDLAVGLPEMQEEPLVLEKRSHSHEAIGTAV
ncbi:uncharacterized protein LOC135496603 isoform X2 [Lineus longissimus]|uniref:uncharacterized protein LOC135496603 isoform X2 n=1 Tax=Lineus longissimus TaxID=88925 RepID=UPI00315D35C1